MLFLRFRWTLSHDSSCLGKEWPLRRQMLLERLSMTVVGISAVSSHSSQKLRCCLLWSLRCRPDFFIIDDESMLKTVELEDLAGDLQQCLDVLQFCSEEQSWFVWKAFNGNVPLWCNRDRFAIKLIHECVAHADVRRVNKTWPTNRRQNRLTWFEKVVWATTLEC